MLATRLKASEVVKVRVALQKRQENKCAVCQRPFAGKVVGCLDHNHQTGHIRGVLCRACNRLEGQVNNRVTMAGGKADPIALLEGLLAYWKHHATPRIKYLHPTHKTEAEKRLARNAKAKAARAQLKGK